MAARKRLRQRDSEATRRKLLEAVAAIMRKDGFSGLRTNRISRLAGKDKNLIRYHFQGLVNLQRAYIREKDYWPPFFERFRLGPGSDVLDLELLFSELMQENLRYFKGDQEMQKIILWQISERNPLLRSISDAREREGALLLDRTDVFFRHTDVDFRSVIALLLGGAYYIVLHANGNGSVVCGIDIGQERDYQVLLKTIGQVVEWAFRQADTSGTLVKAKDGQFDGNMHCFAELERLTSAILKGVAMDGLDKLEGERLSKETVRLKMLLLREFSLMDNAETASRFLKVNVYRLTRIADRLSIPSGELDNFAGDLVELILDLTGTVPEPVISLMVVPTLLWAGKSIYFGQMNLELESSMLAAGLGSDLIEVALIPLISFNAAGSAEWQVLGYLEGYFLKLKAWVARDNLAESHLIDLLISLNMNDRQLAIFYDDYFRRMTEGLSVEECILMISKEIERLGSIPIDRAIDGFAGGVNAREQLLGLLRSKLINLARQMGDQHVNPLKMYTSLNVEELALWQKLQLDQGIYILENLDGFVKRVAHSFAAKGNNELSAGSIKSKLYNRDDKLICSVEQKLILMLEQIRQMKG